MAFPVTAPPYASHMCSVCERWEAVDVVDWYSQFSQRGCSSVGRALAWHARGFVGSSPITSTLFDVLQSVAFTFAGLVAGEGSFTTAAAGTYADGSRRTRFVFCLTMATRDRPLLERLQSFLGKGSICDYRNRNPRWQPTSAFSIRSHAAHHAITIPFAERFLLPSAKRDQFERWRERLVDYERLHPSRYGIGRSICSKADCNKPVRGRGLCRSHYYLVTGY